MMELLNYPKFRLSAVNIKSKIVLMSCCAPCSCGAIAQLKKSGADFCILFYNPNIFPESEYQKRLTEQIRFCKSLEVTYHAGPWDHAAWLECARGLENEPERGRRCSECFRFRFAWGAKWARANGYDAIASVFGISRHKSQAQIDEQGLRLGVEGIKYLPVEWNESRRQNLLAKADFYRQKYCGCEFSIRDIN